LENSVQVALLTELFPPSVGGQEIRLAEIADGLAARDHSVFVFTIKTRATMKAHEILPSGVQVIRDPFVPDYQRPPGSYFPRSPLGIARFALAARRWLARYQFDAIFLNQWPLLHALTLSRSDRKRAIIDWCEIRGSQPYRLFQNVLPRLVAANTAVSDDVAKHIAARTSVDTHMIPSGVVLERYRADAECNRRGILYLGRLSPHKNVPDLISAYNILCDGGYPDPLVIAGAGPDLSTIEACIARSSYASRIELTGAVTEERKIDLLARAKVLVIPSKREGFPRTVAEAMASGLPTVTTSYPGNGTVGVVQHFGCGLCAAPDPAALAGTIRMVLSDWSAFSQAALESAKRLDMNVILAQVESIMLGLSHVSSGV
jgi:glycosyltransferase involved in cell wall biosynthesis